jgi:hypothetical protein
VPTDALTRALARLVDLDARFATSPGRLARALADLAPNDDRGGRLVVTASELGIPTLLRDGNPSEARGRLTDTAGMREDVADQVIRAWTAALGGDVVSGSRPEGWSGPAHPSRRAAGPRPAPAPDGAVSADPGVPSTIRLAVWPDGGLITAVVATTGIFVSGGTPGGWPGWRRVATPPAALSRDVAVAVRGGSDPEAVKDAILVWSERTGVFRRRIRRDGAGLVLDRPEVVAAPSAGSGEPRNPVAVAHWPDGSLDVLWSTDRITMQHQVIRPGLPDRTAAPMPSACATGDHLRDAAAIPHGEHSAWLLAHTARGTVLLQEWDLSLGDPPPWRAVAVPEPFSAVTVVQVGARCRLVGATADGDLWEVDAAAALNGTPSWAPLAPSTLPPATGRVHAVCAASAAGRHGVLAVLGVASSWTARIGRDGDGRVRLGQPRPWLLGQSGGAPS